MRYGGHLDLQELQRLISEVFGSLLDEQEQRWSRWVPRRQIIAAAPPTAPRASAWYLPCAHLDNSATLVSLLACTGQVLLQVPPNFLGMSAVPLALIVAGSCFVITVLCVCTEAHVFELLSTVATDYECGVLPCRMESAAQMAMRQGSSQESLQRVLLEQLRELEGMENMSAEQLTTSLEELQVAALCGLDEGVTKPLGSMTEEFLVKQVGFGFGARAATVWLSSGSQHQFAMLFINVEQLTGPSRQKRRPLFRPPPAPPPPPIGVSH